MNYFEFYGIPISFRPDEAALRRSFYENSRKYHPDFHTLASTEQQAEMLELATLNTRAYQTLSDPDRRMRYILECAGLLEEEGKQPLPQDFLVEMMELNEALMELQFEFDPEALAQVEQNLQAVEAGLEREIQPLLARYDPAVLPAVRDYFLKKRYLLRIRENLSKFAAR